MIRTKKIIPEDYWRFNKFLLDLGFNLEETFTDSQGRLMDIYKRDQFINFSEIRVILTLYGDEEVTFSYILPVLNLYKRPTLFMLRHLKRQYLSGGSWKRVYSKDSHSIEAFILICINLKILNFLNKK